MTDCIQVEQKINFSYSNRLAEVSLHVLLVLGSKADRHGNAENGWLLCVVWNL